MLLPNMSIYAIKKTYIAVVAKYYPTTEVLHP